MSLRRFLVVVALLAVFEFATFEWRFRDLVYLNQPVAVLAQESGGGFASHAQRALSRSTLTRAKLETIAQVAAVRNDSGVLLMALVRLADEYPVDAGVQLRLAETLRAAGRINEAEEAYRRAIVASAGEER